MVKGKRFFWAYVDKEHYLKFFAPIEKHMVLTEESKVFVATTSEEIFRLYVLKSRKPVNVLKHKVFESKREKSQRKYIDVRQLLQEWGVESMQNYQAYPYEDREFWGILIDFNKSVK